VVSVRGEAVERQGHGIDDRDQPEQGQQDDVDEVLEIAQVHRRRGQEEPEGGGPHHAHHECEREQGQVPRGDDALPEDRGQSQGQAQDDQLEQEVHDGGADDRQREDLPREIGLLQESAIAHDAAGAATDDVGEETPDHQSGEDEDGVCRLGVAQEERERHVVDDQLDHRPDEGPEESEDGVLVLDLQFLADQLDEQLPVGPDVAHVLAEATEERASGVHHRHRELLDVDVVVSVLLEGRRGRLDVRRSSRLASRGRLGRAGGRHTLPVLGTVKASGTPDQSCAWSPCPSAPEGSPGEDDLQFVPWSGESHRLLRSVRECTVRLTESGPHGTV
jgi:hypothetical protein